MKSIIVALAFAAVAFAYDDYKPAPAVYNFAWGINDPESYVKTSHQESRDGDRTDGKYTILEADGSTREVAYYVDGDSGFIATVNGVRWPALPTTKGYSADSGEARYVAKPKKVYAAAPTYAPAPKPKKVYIAAPAYAPAPKPKRVYVAAPAPVVYRAPAPAPTVYRAPAPRPVVRRYSSEESTGRATVSIQAPGYSVSY